MKNYTTIDEYITSFPDDVQVLLQKIRNTIHAAAPNATEAIKYGIPTFILNGNLVHFGGYKKHIGFYPAPMGIEAFKEETAQYEAGKGTLQFALDRPLPLNLIERIVKFRVEKNLAKKRIS
ncbi:iron chaperone [Mucilaginibacter calamicampi]|uniref:Iron chaperone n=1 Tax=Mucilaginibacter calamicampi TaxID=1302352 RepID=A0ABW2Z1S0_9SPHI